MSLNSIPNQRVSRDSKLKPDFYKPTYDYLVEKAISLNNKDVIKQWLDAANGIITNESLNYTISPLIDPETKKTIGKLPGEIRDTDLINTVRERNIGEYIGLPYNYTVLVHNPDAVVKRDKELKEKVDILLQQGLINLLNEYYEQTANKQGAVNTGVPSTQDLPDIEKFAKDFVNKWVDDRAINGKNILNLINATNDFDNKRIQAFFYWWACEEFYTYREIINNEVYTSIISPLEGYPIYNDKDFVEDYNGFVIKKRSTLTQIKSLYWKELTEDEKKYIESFVRKDGKYTTTGRFLSSRSWDTTAISEYGMNLDRDYDITDTTEAIDEYTIIWRTEVPVKFRKYTDIFGNKHEEAVPEEYEKIDGIDDEVYEEWIEEVYVGKRFGNKDSGIYLKPKPCDVQRYDRHIMSPKLPVGGKKGILRNVHQNPIPKRLTPFIIIDRLLVLQQERTMAKYQGYIQVIPKSMLNDDGTGTRNEKLFFIKADNTLVYDDTLIDFNTVAQGFRVINMPEVANYLTSLITLREKYRAEALEIANMNDYSLGDVSASTGKGVMQESIYRARLGNVLSITMFNSALEKDHLADLEFSKIAYQDNVRGSYTDRSSGKAIYVNVNLQEHRETDYGTFIENSKIEQRKKELLEQLGFNASQNGDIESAIAVIDSDSIPEIKKVLKQISEDNKKLEAAVEENRNATQRYVADSQTARQDGINQTAIQVATINAEATITAAEIRAQDTGTDSVPDNLPVENESLAAAKREDTAFKRSDANAKNQLKEKQLAMQERLANKKLALQSKQNKGNK